MTLRELVIMWQAKMVETWHHTAQIRMTILAASGNIPKNKMPKYEDFHPYIGSSSQKQGHIIRPGKKIFEPPPGALDFAKARREHLAKTES